MGDFCVRLGILPWEYWRLTVAERNAIIHAWNRAQKK